MDHGPSRHSLLGSRELPSAKPATSQSALNWLALVSGPLAIRRVSSRVHGVCHVAKKSAPRSTKKPQSTKKQPDVAHPGMMGDGTEEQNLDERGNPGARIKKDEVDAAFGRQAPKKRK
jgi:hypothetical protein